MKSIAVGVDKPVARLLVPRAFVFSRRIKKVEHKSELDA